MKLRFYLAFFILCVGLAVPAIHSKAASQSAAIVWAANLSLPPGTAYAYGDGLRTDASYPGYSLYVDNRIAFPDPDPYVFANVASSGGSDLWPNGAPQYMYPGDRIVYAVLPGGSPAPVIRVGFSALFTTRPKTTVVTFTLSRETHIQVTGVPVTADPSNPNNLRSAISNGMNAYLLDASGDRVSGPFPFSFSFIVRRVKP